MNILFILMKHEGEYDEQQYIPFISSNSKKFIEDMIKTLTETNTQKNVSYYLEEIAFIEVK